mgnify:CR=1 FL=1
MAFNNSIKRGIFEIILYIFLIGFVISLAVFAGFALQGFSESFLSNIVQISTYLGSYLIYTPLLIVAILLIIFPIARMIFIKEKEHPATQDNPGFIRLFTVSYLYNPEDSFIWNLAKEFKESKNINWINNIVRVIFISILFFGLLSIMQIFFPQLNISGVPAGEVAQQISPTSDIIFGAGIPAIAENGALLFIFFFLLGINAYLCAKYIKDKKMRLWIFFLVGFLIICPLMGYLWMSYHSVVYSNSEAKLIATFVFGWLGSTITLATGIFFFFFMWHFMNNLIIKVLELATYREDIALIGILLWVGLLITYISIEVFFWKRKKRSPEAQLIS